MPSRSDSRFVRLLRNVYDVLLSAYPSDFLREFGGEMRLAFRNDVRAVVDDRRIWTLVSFAFRILRDWLLTLPLEWKESSDALCSLRLSGASGRTRTDPERQNRVLSTVLLALGVSLMVVGWLRWIELMGAGR